MPSCFPRLSQPPLSLRLAGLWIIWSAWCSVAGWLLSAAHHLDGYGYAAVSPALAGCAWLWLKSTGGFHRAECPGGKLLRRLRQPAPFVYFCIVFLSLLAGLLHTPWSFDAATYRLPRVLFWWQAQHWYWTGSLDHRMDYSSTGFEWQMLPVMQLAHGDRLVFLLNWIPFTLMPGLVFLCYRALGLSNRSARRWMWLLPAGYCFALQCSGVQNDAYTVNYPLAAIAALGWASRSRRAIGFWLAVMATALLTGAKLSNLPLLLPLGVLMLDTMRHVRWLDWRLPIIGVLALLCSCAPLACLAWKHTGDWTGDPEDQWRVRPHHTAGNVVANLVVLANDATQPPLFPENDRLNAALQPLNRSSFIEWLKKSHGDFKRVFYGRMVNEGTAGPGSSLALYVTFLLGGVCFVRHRGHLHAATILSWPWRLAPWLAWVAYGLLLIKLGSCQSPRIAAPYFPLLLAPLLRYQRVCQLERTQLAGMVAVFAAALVLPPIVLSPVRPLFPVQTIARWVRSPAFDKLAADYRIWQTFRDDLAPMRAQLPADATLLGYGGGLYDTPYGLLKPIGSRTVVELGLPIGSGTMPPPGLKYAVVTERGLQQRYKQDLESWIAKTGGKILYTMQRNGVLDAHSPPAYESWYLVKFQPLNDAP